MATKSPSSTSRRFRWDSIALATLPFAAAAVAPPSLENHAAVIGAGVAMAFAVAFAWRGPVAVNRRTLLPLLLPASAAAWVVLRSVFAANPRVAIFGVLGSGNGAAMWTAAACVFLFAAVTERRGAARAATLGLALCATVASLFVLLDAAGVIPHADSWSREYSGLLGSSNAVAQFLLLGVGGALSLATERKTRAAGLVAAGACAAGLVAAQSRAAWVALVAASVAGFAVAWVRSPSARATVASVAAAVLTLVPAALIGATALGSSAIADAAGALLSDRPALWRSAAAQVAQSPLFGSGCQQFSAYYSWSPDASRIFGVDTIGAFSPHSVILEWLLSGGVVGLVLGAAAIAAIAVSAWGAMRDANRADLRWSIGAALVAWFVASTVSIIEAPALMAAALLAGTLVAHAPVPGPPALTPAQDRASLAAIAALALLTAFTLTPPLLRGATALTWDPRATGPQDLPRYSAAYESTGDPTYLTMGLTALLGQTSGDYPDELAEDARMLARTAPADARWHADLARLSAAAEALRSAEPTAAVNGRIGAFLDAGKIADPSSSVWEYLRRREARRRGVTP